MNKPRESINWETNNSIEQSSALFYQLLTGGIETIILLWNWIYMTTYACTYACTYTLYKSKKWLYFCIRWYIHQYIC